MLWNLRYWLIDTLCRYWPLAAARILGFALLGMLMIGQCLTHGVQATLFSHSAMECHDDCWFQQPLRPPMAVLQPTPMLCPPQPALQFVLPASSAHPGHDDNGCPLAPRSPPTPLPH
jgi:hypothetical protein